MKRVGFLGCGKIGQAILTHIMKRGDTEITFIQDPYFQNVYDLHCPILSKPDLELLSNTDLVIECATADILKENFSLILGHCDLMLFSVTAYADPEFEKAANRQAARHNHHIYLPHGAILGLDGIFDGRKCWTKVTIETVKSPQSLGREDQQRAVLYDGPTRGACDLFPRNVNVHAAVALSGLGFDHTYSRIIAEPGKTTNDHLITLEGDGVRFQIIVSSFAAGSITGAYTPHSACGSIDRVLGTSSGIVNV